MMRTDRESKRPQKKLPSGGANFLPPDGPLILTVYLRHRRPVRRRPGSAIDFAELTRRVTLSALKAERRRILKGSVEQVRRFARRQHMTVKAVDFLARSVTLRAKAADAERAFSTRLLWIDDSGDRRCYPPRRPPPPPPLKPNAPALLGFGTPKPPLS